MPGITIMPVENGFEAVANGIWREAKGKEVDSRLAVTTGYYERLVVTVKRDLWDFDIGVSHQTVSGINNDTKTIRARIVHNGIITFSVVPNKTDGLIQVRSTHMGLLKIYTPDMFVGLTNLDSEPVFHLRRRRPGESTFEVMETAAGNGVFVAREMGFGDVSTAKLAALTRLGRGMVKEVAPPLADIPVARTPRKSMSGT